MADSFAKSHNRNNLLHQLSLLLILILSINCRQAQQIDAQEERRIDQNQICPLYALSNMIDRPTTTSSCLSSNKSCRQLQFIVSGESSDKGILDEWHLQLPYPARVVIYVIILGIVVIVIFLILKFMSHFDVAEASTERLAHVAAEEEEEVAETTPLVEEPSALTYGTETASGGGDEETASRSSSSEDVYNSKLCVICYEERRNCFFVPCGHSATCRGCARKLMAAENRVCPICRRVIRKFRKLLFTL